jgi:tetratricopeptide (TPR) repeat protein
VRRLAAALSCLLGLSPGAGARGAEDAPPSFAATATELGAELNGIGRALGDARARWDDAAALDPGRAAETLQSAQLAVIQEDFERAVGLVLGLLAREGVERDPVYPEALGLYGEALVALGLPSAGAEALRSALEPPSTPSLYRALFIRALELAPQRQSVEDVRRAWERYQRHRDAGRLDPEDRKVRYLYARALYRAGARTEASALFEAIGEEDPYALRARYHLAVLRVEAGDLTRARVAFEELRARWQSQGRALSLQMARAPAWLEDVDDDGPPLQVQRIGADGKTLDTLGDRTAGARRPLSETIQAHQRMGQVIALALARLDATRGHLESATSLYRQVPPGSPDSPTATQELVWVLFRRGEFQRSARVLDALLAGRGDDRTFAELSVWKAHMLALATEYDAARTAYDQLEAMLNRRKDELNALRSGPAPGARVFPEAVLAWNDPATASGARTLDAALVEQAEALDEAQTTLAALREAAQSGAPLPAARVAHEVREQLTLRLVRFEARLTAAPTGPALQPFEVARLRDSARRLRERLEGFSGVIQSAELRWRARIEAAVAQEVPALEAQRAALVSLGDSSHQFGRALALNAWLTLNRFAADAHYRQVDLVYWRKDEVTRRIRALRREQRRELEPMNDEVREFWDEVRRDPIPGFVAPEAGN